MLDRNAEITRNKLQVLQHQKNELLRNIAASEALLAELLRDRARWWSG